jgi:hypothetical protein
MVRPRKYHSAREAQAARRASRRKWIEAHPDQWRAVLARNYIRRRYRSLFDRISALKREVTA